MVARDRVVLGASDADVAHSNWFAAVGSILNDDRHATLQGCSMFRQYLDITHITAIAGLLRSASAFTSGPWTGIALTAGTVSNVPPESGEVKSASK